MKIKQYVVLIIVNYNVLSMNFIYDSIAPEKKENGRILHINQAIEIMHLHYIVKSQGHAQNLHHALDFNSLLI